jgi:glycosyltransferase involved in cell wall biosynthesis
MQIVLLHTEFSMHGAALSLLTWATDLVRQGHSVVAVHNPRDDGPLREVYLANGIALSESCAVDNTMVAICNTAAAASYVLQVAGVARTIWWLHDGEIGFQLMAANPGAQSAFRAADAIIFPSTVIRERIFKSYLLGVPEHRQHIVPYGIAPVTDGEPVSEASNRPVRVISVGSIYPRKRQDTLIHAVSRLADLSIDCLLVGEMFELERSAVEAVRAQSGRIRFTGARPHTETLRLMQHSDIFALPSASECLPIAPLEAGLRGRAVVLSDLPAHDGIWRHGVNCLMHPVGDSDLLAHMLRIFGYRCGAAQAAGRRGPVNRCAVPRGRVSRPAQPGVV